MASYICLSYTVDTWLKQMLQKNVTKNWSLDSNWLPYVS